MLKNIIFDVGKVLFDYHPPKIVKNLLPHRQDGDFFIRELHDSDLWQKLDEGTITEDQVIHILNDIHPENIEKEISTILNNFVYELDPIEPIIDLFKIYSNSHQTYLLTNFQDRPFKQLVQAYPFLSLAKGQVVSAEEKVMKPHPNIYKILLERYQITSSECLFIDDREENIAAAKDMGLEGIVYRSYPQLIKDLAKFKL